MRPRSLRALGTALGIALASAGAGALPPGHPEPLSATPPLHASLARADAVAIARVEAVGTGRIQLRDAIALFGSVPERFALKRPPSSPPPWSAGDRVLLPLAGAREPFVLVDPERALPGLGVGDEARWSAAARALLAARGRPEALARGYASMLATDSPALEREAAIGLAAPDVAPADPVSLARLVDLAARSPQPELRRPCARAAVRTGAGRRLLLDRLPGDAGDPEVLALALRSAVGDPSEPARDAALRALGDERAALREAALAPAAALARAGASDADALTRALLRVATDDPEPALRDAARRALARGAGPG